MLTVLRLVKHSWATWRVGEFSDTAGYPFSLVLLSMEGRFYFILLIFNKKKGKNNEKDFGISIDTQHRMSYVCIVQRS